jgi:hypothetical protein
MARADAYDAVGEIFRDEQAWPGIGDEDKHGATDDDEQVDEAG